MLSFSKNSTGPMSSAKSRKLSARSSPTGFLTNTMQISRPSTTNLSILPNPALALRSPSLHFARLIPLAVASAVAQSALYMLCSPGIGIIRSIELTIGFFSCVPPTIKSVGMIWSFLSSSRIFVLKKLFL